MKSTLIASTALLFTAIAMTACRTTKVYRKPVIVHSSSLPPGQAKKITGEKSAKRYAPGQQKKSY